MILIFVFRRPNIESAEHSLNTGSKSNLQDFLDKRLIKLLILVAIIFARIWYRCLPHVNRPLRSSSFLFFTLKISSVAFHSLRDSLPFEYILSIRVPVDSVVVAEQTTQQCLYERIAIIRYSDDTPAQSSSPHV